MASWVRFFTQSPGIQSLDDIEEDDVFPALLAETHPLPPAAPAAHGNVSRLPIGIRRPAFDSIDAVRQERVA